MARPAAWQRTRRIVGRAVAPIERFLQVEAASGIVLVVATLIALGWANSPWASAYERLWQTPITIGVGDHALRRPLQFLIDDALMTLFFFVVGLEIRREVHQGELSRWRSAALPILAAIGGMLVPAAIYTVFNASRPTAGGWGVPMATDIAFAVGILALLGKRVPPALRVFLLALAIIDDIGAILVIAVFFSKGFAWSGILAAVLGIAVIAAFRWLRIGSVAAYVLPAAALWWGLLRAGVHPTIAGVIVGLMTPVKPAGRRLQRMLHPWVSFGVMPIFALANAGIGFGNVSLSGPSRALSLGIVVGLVAGKPIGIVAASFLAVKSKLSPLPTAVGWSGVLLVGLVAGIGFTMAIFMSGLALAPEHLGAGKLSVLCASVAAAVIALAFGRITLREVAAKSAAEAEASPVD